MFPVGQKGRNWLQGLAADLRTDLPFISCYFDAATRQRLMAAHPAWCTAADGVRHGRVPLQRDLLQRATRMDFGNYLAEDILVKVDRASMLNSLEVRAPMLDYRLIEFAFRKVPSRLKASPTSKKILLKRLAARLLPAGFDLQRKQGFSIPIAAWIGSGALGDLFRSVLLDPSSIFDRRTVDALLRGQASGRNNGERLFSLVMFELWRREYGITL
jgi:asparagine synthase (glutamine-hydrolysing)